MDTRVTVEIGEQGAAYLAVLGEDEAPVEVTEFLSVLAAVGLDAMASSSDEPVARPAATGREFANLYIEGDVRFYVGGQLLSGQAGLELVAEGVRQSLMAMVRVASPEPAPPAPAGT